MTKPEPEAIVEETTNSELFEGIPFEMPALPSMTLNMPPATLEPEKELITDDQLKGVYDEIMNNLRGDRNQIDEWMTNLAEMVFNEGDSTTSSKEALVNLAKIKVDTAAHMGKVADLMTRLKMKSKDTFPAYLAAHQNNNITIENGNKRALLEAIENAAGKKAKTKYNKTGD